MFNQELIKTNGVVDLVEHYKRIKTEVLVTIKTFKSLNQQITGICGEYKGFITYKWEMDENDVVNKINRSFWELIADKFEISAILSEKRKDEFYKAINDKNLPDFTLENVMGTVTSWCEGAGKMVEEVVNDAWRYLRPWHSKQKTNKGERIGKKVILNNVMDDYFRHISYHSETRLNSIEKAFSLLDGKGTPKYPNTLPCIINEACKRYLTEGETDYFKFKIYSKNLHLVFKRKDLVEKIEQMCGKNTLESGGSYGPI
jgi:hypothetical protein